MMNQKVNIRKRKKKDKQNPENISKIQHGVFNTDQFDYEELPRNIILHGPVGTGKTYLAGILASGIIEGKITSMEDIESLLKSKSDILSEYGGKTLERNELTNVTFHQSYGYEE
ncbi:MAG: hypothetical protein M1427_00135, partial [Candidatus Thermoplasmatota archaeon]|nr:hypothetical protein [Candidatus Thermoplasmatota archaeon]